METYSQNKITDRQPVAAGRFYPADKATLSRDLTALFEECKKTDLKRNVQAIISPHAGYVFSGKTAASAFSAIPGNASYENIFIIGSSHVMSFDGASVYNTGDYITPLGRMTVNREIAEKLMNENKVFNFPATSHLHEHSIEVQLPFIQYYFKKTPMIIPIIIGANNDITIKLIAEALRPWFSSANLFIISSDFSHYPPYAEAIELDKLTALGIKSGKPAFFLNALEKNSQKKGGQVTSMCGWTSGLTLLYLAEGNINLEFNLLDYSNSGDSPYGGKDEVVGYHAISLTGKQDEPGAVKAEQNGFSFTGTEKDQLFTLARKSIQSRLNHDQNPAKDDTLSLKLHEPLGAFVTLKINGCLRGCIGRFISSDPLYEVIRTAAISSAFEDPRFPPLTKEEYGKTDFEITVLGPLKRISSIDEIILGRHGIYIKKDMNSGTMLPQVATEHGWTVEQFLGHTSRDKAGIGWDGWKNAELYIYEGVVLEENETRAHV
jgi:hypothetical protein